MEQYIKNIIPNIKDYGKLLSQKEFFINKTWFLYNEVESIFQYTFKKRGELIISKSGDFSKGTWELLSPTKIILESEYGNMQLDLMYLDNYIIILTKPSINKELFIFVNEGVNPEEYLRKIENGKKDGTITESGNELYVLAVVIGFFAIFIIGFALAFANNR